MKKTFYRLPVLSGLFAFALSLGLIATAPVAYAQADQPANSVATQTAASVDVTVYGQSHAQVEETRSVYLKKGRNSIRLDGIAAKYRPDSLSPISADGPGKFTQRSATYQAPDLTPEKILERAIGKQVTLAVGSGATARDITGTLQAVNNGRLILQTQDGSTVIAAASEVSVKNLSGLSNSASLVVEADVTHDGVYKLNFIYETDGLGWEAKHTVVYDDKALTAKRWTTTVSVSNQSGTAFNNATFWLVSGDVTQPQAESGRAYMAGAPSRSAADAPASVEAVGEQKVFKLEEKVSLTDGQTRQVTLYTFDNVKVEREFYIPSQQRYYAQRQGERAVSVRLNMANCLKNNMGSPLPAGAVKVYQRNSGGLLQQTGTAYIGQLAVDESFVVNIGTSTDVKYEQVLKSSQKDSNDNRFENRLYEVKLHNYKTNEQVSVTVEVIVPENQQNLGQLTRKTANQAFSHVIVPQGGTKTFEYTLQVQVR